MIHTILHTGKQWLQLILLVFEKLASLLNELYSSSAN